MSPKKKEMKEKEAKGKPEKGKDKKAAFLEMIAKKKKK